MEIIQTFVKMMNAMKKELLYSCSAEREYVSPRACLLPFEVEAVLCESPLPGGNEGIGFENWN
jgi:hypothetical protein